MERAQRQEALLTRFEAGLVRLEMALERLSHLQEAVSGGPVSEEEKSQIDAFIHREITNREGFVDNG